MQGAEGGYNVVADEMVHPDQVMGAHCITCVVNRINAWSLYWIRGQLHKCMATLLNRQSYHWIYTTKQLLNERVFNQMGGGVNFNQIARLSSYIYQHLEGYTKHLS